MLQRDGLNIFNLAFAERMVRRAKFTQRDQHHDRPGAARAKIYGMRALRDMCGGEVRKWCYQATVSKLVRTLMSLICFVLTERVLESCLLRVSSL